ncbi:MAG TPA: DUF488 domain-containing protein [Vicinamibacterales bacterium]|nr:DUF488 domain-containing protein [Vicinamibacterales bacterium]
MRRTRSTPSWSCCASTAFDRSPTCAACPPRQAPAVRPPPALCSLLESGVDYRHFAALGVLRAPQDNSVNAGLRNASYRGYADHMPDARVDEALIQLIDYARRARTAAMCAELRYSDCHRQLLCDALLVRDVQVRHIRPGGFPNLTP